MEMLIHSLITRINVCLFCFRIPESLFLGAEVILNMEDDELEEMGWTVLVFLVSIVSQRMVHLVLEVN